MTQSLIFRRTFSDVLLHKVSHFPKSLPTSICNTIPSNIPNFETTYYDDCIEWSDKYNNIPFRSSIFAKAQCYPSATIMPK